MLKPLKTEHRGRLVVLECTHKRNFPPPQVYGATDDDIDSLWRQGAINQNEYQLLQTWREKCHLIVMGPRCLDCPLALLQKPRPGRPNVIETEPWLAAKERMRWEDMKKRDSKEGFFKTSEALASPVVVGLEGEDEDGPEPVQPDEEDAPQLDDEDAPDALHLDEEDAPEEPETEPEFEFMTPEEVAEPSETLSLDDDILDALAED